MNRKISRVSYLLGLACVVIALLMRGLNAFEIWTPGYIVQGVTIWYMSFYKGALLFLLVGIAGASMELLKSAKPQEEASEENSRAINSAVVHSQPPAEIMIRELSHSARR